MFDDGSRGVECRHLVSSVHRALRWAPDVACRHRRKTREGPSGLRTDKR